ncbi:MAG TPA: PLP-dependent aspartate aminotransferase family protein [Actinomycetales bacterium]|nr:PLP-dependent aspartate aminotransferase family protein [Actinomycetales bacterium]
MSPAPPSHIASGASLLTRAVHAGRAGLTEAGVHVPGIDLSTTNPLATIESGGSSYELLATGGRPTAETSHVYARLWNPTVARFEDALAELEGTAQSVAFATGMAALSAVLLSLGEEGKRHVVAVRPLYGGSDHLLATGLLGTEVTFTTADGVAGALRPDTGLVVLETPANPTLDLVDIRAVVAAAAGVPVMVDNTFATPVLQQPAALGATLVMHSATKFIGGHGDVMGGVVATAGPQADEWAGRLRRVRAITGALLHPLGAYLLHRGLQTLPVRVRAQSESAAKVAVGLAAHPDVERVFYPGLGDGESAGLVGTQMSSGGAVLSFRVRGGYEHAARVTEAVRLITHAVSLGGVDTLIQHPAALTHRPVTGDAAPSRDLLRLSVGLEDPQDVAADLHAALESASRA